MLCWSFHVCTNKRCNILSFLLFVMVSCHFLVLLTSVSVAVIVILVTFACKTRFKLFFIVTHTHRDSFSYTHNMCIHLVVFVYVNLFWQFFAFRFVCTVPEIWQITQAVWLHTHTATCKSHLYTNTDKVMRIIYEWHWKTFTYVWVLVYMYAWVCMCYCRTANMVLASTFSCQKRKGKR